MKKRIAILLMFTGFLAMCSIQPAPAQDASKGAKPGTLAPRRLHRWNALAKWLQLTDEQKAKIKSIASNAREQARKIRTDTTLTPEQKRKQLLELRKSTRQQIGSVLTPEQREKMRKFWAWRWHRWQVWRAYRAGKGSKMFRMSPEQKRKLGAWLKMAPQRRWRNWWRGPF
ncbi:MAG: Spy/CpxP family protein refolding chaperone [Armatimonadota bacterium]